MNISVKRKLVLVFAVLVFVLGFVLFCQRTGLWSALVQGEDLQGYIAGFGWKGPLVIILLMTGAIVVSPLPSAPIALAAGALYGHTWGTVYVTIGALTGALIAFSLARALGRDAVQRWLGRHLSMPSASSQNSLMLTVFIFRMIPFISFDIVSYAAGLTSITWWRFSIATAAGVIPVSFLLAHFGGEMVGGGTRQTVITVLLLGFLTLLPLAYAKWKSTWKKGKGQPKNP
ncbi:MAG: TVP38/TMEM64 family protein [Desulfovibrionales bacterium]